MKWERQKKNQCRTAKGSEGEKKEEGKILAAMLVVRVKVRRWQWRQVEKVNWNWEVKKKKRF
jgi:hypothetical protein